MGAMSPADQDLLERLQAAIRTAGLTCWEYSLAQQRVTWFDGASADASELRELIERAAAAVEDRVSKVVRRLDEQGNVRHFRIRLQVLRDAAGNPERYVGTTRNVTDEVESEQRLERASLSIQQGHWEVDQRTGVHWTSKAYLSLLGLPEDSEACNTLEKATALIHPDDRESGLLAAQRHFAGAPPFDVELRLQLVDGSYRWFRVRGLAKFDSDGHPITVSGSITDIHKQRLAEEALREVQARLSRAIQGTQDGLWEIDPIRRKLWLSPRACALLGFADGELGDRLGALRARAHPDDYGAMESSISVAVEFAALIDLETRMRTRSGEYRWYRLRGTPVTDTSGVVTRISGSMQDVTEAHEARDELVRATAAAQSANRAKSEFLANVSHEIRTPMNGILGMTRLLLDTSLDTTQRDFAETIRASADSLMSIINDILDFSKIEAGKLDIETLEMDVPANVEEVGSVMAFQAAAKNLELIVNVNPDVPRHVRGDPQRIRQCLINLIGNAIKFTRAGEIVCEVSVRRRDATTVWLRFSVRDTGIGIAPATLRSLFEPFVQADSSTTRHFGGTGLGLSIVRRLVEMMGGQVDVVSQLGEGSTFWFELPFTEVESPAVDVPTPHTQAGQRILVVDDNETNRRVLLTQLSHAGYEVVLASGGREALATMRSALGAARPFDAVLTDFQMPDMDGAMLGEQINSDHHLSKARVVLLTSMDRHGETRRFAALGFAGYLSKPVRPRELLATLEKVLSRDAQEWHTQTHPLITLNVVQQALRTQSLSGLVLLVEDNLVNQKVARRFLERMGCEVEVAENGLEAVRAFERGTYRMILMDVQMPHMDGYEATERIRSLESVSARDRRTPIIALTANAMSGQLDRCLQVGMDALLTKPINVEQLAEMLRRFGLDSPAETVAHSAPAVDLAALNDLTGGDAEFAADLARSFFDNSRELFAQIRAYLADADRRQVARLTHQLAGASANIHAFALHELCAQLESGAPTGESAELESLVTRIGVELQRVNAVLQQDSLGAIGVAS